MLRRFSIVLATGFLLTLLPFWSPAGGPANAEEKGTGTYGAIRKAPESVLQMRASQTLGAGANIKGSYNCSCSGGKDGNNQCRTVRSADTLQCDKADTNACSGTCNLTVVISGGNNVLSPQ